MSMIQRDCIGSVLPSLGTFILVALLATSGCCTKEAKTFLAMNESQRELYFVSAPLETQYRLAMDCAECGEPPETRYTSMFASQGESVIPFLLAKLNQESGYRRINVINMFIEIGLFHADLRTRPDVLHALDVAIAEIDDAIWHDHCAKWAQEIRTRGPQDRGPRSRIGPDVPSEIGRH